MFDRPVMVRVLFTYTPRTLLTLPSLASVGFRLGSKVPPFAKDAGQMEPEGGIFILSMSGFEYELV